MEEYIGEFPNICGSEDLIEKTIADAKKEPVYLGKTPVDYRTIKSAFCIALHMHQPLIPGGGHDLQTAEVISNLQYMWEHQGEGDNHNAPAFAWCYKRMGEFVPQLFGEGKEPRAMLEYSGTLFHGLRKMGQNDVIDALKYITTHPEYWRAAEWLGCPWGHAVAPSTPMQDFRLHVKAWQHHFAAIFGLEALGRVRGFSPSEMALPNHPDVAYEYIKTLVDCGYEWVLIQEHSVEHPEDGWSPKQPNIPHRLVAKNADGDEVSITALIKTQGSDTKLVAQMQPYYEARGMDRFDYNGVSVAPLVTQVADGENGGVMMNEFPGKFNEVMREASHTDCAPVNGTEYLELLWAQGIKPEDLPKIQPVKQKQIWDRVEPGCGTQKLNKAIEELKKEDHQFHMDGGSWTDDISWVNGYDNVLKPMERTSALFNEKIIQPKVATNDPRYQKALFHLMSSQTSCYRYWGQGLWTDYGIELCRRADEVLKNDF